MIEIRPEQFEAFERQAARNFHRRLAGFLREEIPDEAGVMDPASLENRVADADRRAAEYGITSESGVAQFACLTFYAGEDFDDDPEVRDFLKRQDGIPADEKLETLIDHLPDN